MKRNVLALTLLGVAAVAATAWAIEQEIEVSARMRIGLAFTNPINMAFTPAATDFINFYTPIAGTDTVAMATDGTLTSSDMLKLEPTNATGTPGSVEFTGDENSTVDISCDTSAVMMEPVSSTTITVNALEVKMNTGGATGTGTACAGLGTSPLNYQVAATNKIILGGTLVGNANIKTAEYDTATGGTPATIRVVYH